MKQFQKMVLLTMAVVFGLMGQADVYGSQAQCNAENTKKRASIRVIESYTPRSSARYSDLICGQNALCGSFPSESPNFDIVDGQVGIYYYDTEIMKNLFVQIYSLAAEFSEGKYMIPDWDRKVFLMIINPNSPPLALQPDWMLPGLFKSNILLYKQKGKDYSDYPDKAAVCTIFLEIDFENEVFDHFMYLYDQDGNIIYDDAPSSQNEFKKFKMGIGDEFLTLYWGTADDSPGIQWSMILENYTQVTQEPVFRKAGFIPGRDFGCSHCVNKIDFTNTDLYFRLQGSMSDVVEPVWSEKILLGKLKDMVPENPELITLTDVIEGLKVLALGDPQNFHFRNINGDNKFGAEEVIWLLRKIAGLP